MNIDEFLSRLEKVKKTGKGWMACCPAHQDRSPSLSIAVGKSGGIVAKCWTGCGIEEIVGAVGMTLSDLMPDSRPDEVFKRERFPFADAFKGLSFHATVCAIGAIDAANGQPFSPEDKDTLLASAAAIHEAYRMVSA